MAEAMLDLVNDFHLLVRLKVFNTEQMNQAVFAFRRAVIPTCSYTQLRMRTGILREI